MSNYLKEVTYLTIKNLKKREIILPGDYSNTFENIAKQMEVDFTKEDVILKDLHEDADHVDKVVKKTNESICSLQKSTTDAQKAIEEKNSESLNNIKEELSSMQEQINFLQEELFADPLTGAYNRKWFVDYFLDKGFFKSDGNIAFLDLNNFKQINDTYGHITGDQVLRYLVKFLKAELSNLDANVVRYAGDEFIVLFHKEKTKSLDSKLIMQKVQTKLANQKLKSSKVKELSFSFSFGLTEFKKGQDLEHTLELVDELMYKNKKEMKNK